MDFLDFVSHRAEAMVGLGLAHAGVVAISVLLASIVGISLGIVSHSKPKARESVLAVTGAFLTIPSFALFILLLPLLGLGAKPVVVALTLYGLMPIVRNTVTGLNEVDPAVLESAMGMGMSARQRLVRIQIPIAWPVIITGIRVTTLILLGIAAIGDIVNGPGYGEYIFTGLARVGTPVAVNYVLAGALGVMILALFFDGLILLVRRLTTSRGLR